MSDTSKPNVSISISGGQIREFITGDKNVYGNEIGTQISYDQTPEIEKLAAELDEFLYGLVQKVPDAATKEGEKIVVDTAIKEIDSKPSLKDRLVAFLTAGTFEAIKQFTKNPFVEVFLAAFKASLEAKKKS